MACFDECGCTCYEPHNEFDEAVRSETRLDLDMQQLANSHAGWYHDLTNELADSSYRWEVSELGLRSVGGVYILWRQHDYCLEHEAEHLQALYVGKAGTNVESRLLRHRLEKDIGGELATHLSVWPSSNRLAKYVEQLLLDLYVLPLNAWENKGERRLCHHIGPGDWN